MRLFKYAVGSLILIQSFGVVAAIIVRHGISAITLTGLSLLVTAICLALLLFRSGRRGDTGSPFERLLLILGFTSTSQIRQSPTMPRTLDPYDDEDRSTDQMIYFVALLSAIVWSWAISPIFCLIVCLVGCYATFKTRSSSKALMEIDEYWELVGAIDTEALMRNDDRAALGTLLTELDRLSKDELNAFYGHTVKRLYALNREVIRSKCEFGNSGEGFLYHRLYVIARGRKYYSEFLEQPQSLAQQNTFDVMLYCMEGFDEFCLENDIGTNNPEPTE